MEYLIRIIHTDGSVKEIGADHYTVKGNCVQIYKQRQISKIVETAGTPHDLVAAYWGIVGIEVERIVDEIL